MVAPPWFHLVRAHGVFAPNARLRPRIVPKAPALAAAATSAPALGVEQLALFADVVALDDRRASRKPWAWLLRHVSRSTSRCARSARARCAGSRSPSRPSASPRRSREE